MAKYPDAVPPEAVDYLRSFGLDPMDIARDGWDETGHWVLAKRADGTRIYDPVREVFMRHWRKWPEEFDPRYFKRLLKGA